jgi:hypothetical protein
MKNVLLVSALTALLLGLGTVTILYAQNTPRLEGVIPFNFMVGNTSLSAGDYSIQSTNGILRIYGKEKREGVYVSSTPDKPLSPTNGPDGKLIFNKYGNQYFLTKVVNPFDAAEQRLPKSASEKEAAKRVSNAKTVLIAMKVH